MTRFSTVHDEYLSRAMTETVLVHTRFELLVQGSIRPASLTQKFANLSTDDVDAILEA